MTFLFEGYGTRAVTKERVVLLRFKHDNSICVVQPEKFSKYVKNGHVEFPDGYKSLEKQLMRC